MTTIPNRRYGKANSGSSDIVRLQQRHRYRRTRIAPSITNSTKVRV